jgi:hypothetical protein
VYARGNLTFLTRACAREHRHSLLFQEDEPLKVWMADLKHFDAEAILQPLRDQMPVTKVFA